MRFVEFASLIASAVASHAAAEPPRDGHRGTAATAVDPRVLRARLVVAVLWHGNFNFFKGRQSAIFGVWAAPGAAQTPKMTDFAILKSTYPEVLDLLFLRSRSRNRRFWGSKRPPPPGKPPQTVGGSAPHLFR